MRRLKRTTPVRPAKKLALSHVQRALAATTRTAQALVQAASEKELVERVCAIVVDAGYRFCWVGLAENDDNKTVRPLAWAGHEDGYLYSSKFTWSDTANGRGPAGTSIRTAKPAVFHDVVKNRNSHPWRTEARRRGYRSICGLPLVVRGVALGTLCIYAGQPAAFGAQEIELLAHVAETLSFGIMNFRDGQRTREALREASELNTQVIDNTPSGVIVYNQNLRCELWNPYMEDLTGVPAREIVGKNPLDLFPVLRELRVEEGLRRALAGEPNLGNITPFTLPHTGDMVWLSGRYAPVRDAAGWVTKVVVTVRDVTEVKKVEEALRASEQRLQEAARVSYIGIFDHDRITDAIYHSSVLREMFGYGPDEPVTMQGLLDRIHPEDREAVREAIRSAQDPMTDGSFKREYRVTQRDGSVRWLAASAQTVFEGEGDARRALRTFGATIDVTERRQMEEALRQSERRLRQAARVSEMGIFDHDMVANTIYWSPEQRKNYGVELDKPVTLQMYLDGIYPEDREAMRAAVQRAHDPAGDGLFDVEHRIVRRDGAIRWLATRSETTFEGEGSARRAVRTTGAVIDITERKRIAEREVARRKRLEELAELSMMLSGDPVAVYERVVRMIGRLFDVRTVCLSEIESRQLLFKAVYANGKFMADAGSSPLDITPCGSVEAAKDIVAYDRVAERFPQASFLREHNAYSYCGFPALDNEGRVIAVTCLLDDKPHEFTEEDKNLLRIIGQRLAAEVERGKSLAQRARAEKELRENQHRLLEAQRIGHMGSWELNLVTGQLAWSEEIDRILELDPRHFGATHEAFLNAVHPEDREAVNAVYAESVATKAPYEIVYRLRTKDGRVKWVQERGTTEYSAEGKPVRSTGTVQDITERWQAEDALRTSEERLASMIATAMDGIISTDENQHIVLFNQTAEKMFGYKASEVIGKPIAMLMPQRFRAAHAEHMRSFSQNQGEARPMGLRQPVGALRASGEEFPIEASISQVAVAGKMFLTVILRDISERRRAEEALRGSEHRLREAQSLARLGSWELNLATSELTWSNEIYQIFESDPERFDTTYEAFLHAVHPDDREMVNRTYRESVANKAPYEITHRIRMSDGRIKWVHERAMTEYSTEGTPVRSTGTVQDITERKLAELRLAESLREKETLLREIHHRVKNNLQIISSLLHFQSKKVADDEAKAVFLEGQDRLRSMILVHDRLYRSQNLSAVDFGDYVNSLAQQLVRSNEDASRNVRLTIEADNVSLPVETALPCGMIVSELLTNVFKYAFPDGSSGEALLRVTAHGDRMVIMVQDNGVGFGDAGSAASTGFGLQLVYTLTEQLNGLIRIESSSGTSITVDVPLGRLVHAN